MQRFAKIVRCAAKKMRFAILGAWAGAFALVQTDLAQAAYPGSDAAKRVELKLEVGAGVNYRPRDPDYQQTRTSFKTETRKFEFPYGIIINQTNSRGGMRNYNHSKSDRANIWDRHDCSINVCAHRNKNPRAYPRTAAPMF
jgi:hypothetical protein